MDNDTRLPVGVKDFEALEAYIDLVQTAEDALPLAKQKGVTPSTTQRSSDMVELGGEYILNYNKVDAHIHVLMILERKKDAYIVYKAWSENENE